MVVHLHWQWLHKKENCLAWLCKCEKGRLKEYLAFFFFVGINFGFCIYFHLLHPLHRTPWKHFISIDVAMCICMKHSRLGCSSKPSFISHPGFKWTVPNSYPLPSSPNRKMAYVVKWKSCILSPVCLRYHFSFNRTRGTYTRPVGFMFYTNFPFCLAIFCIYSMDKHHAMDNAA